MDNPEMLIRSALAFLIIIFLPFVIILLCPFLTLFDGTSAMTSDLFASVNTGDLLTNFFLVYALKTAIELFGYNSILLGLSWYFIIVVCIFLASWFVAGFLTRSHKVNILFWLFGIGYVFLITWIAVTSIPSGNHPASDAFAALYTLGFSINVWFPLLMYALVCLGGATLGTLLGRYFKGHHPEECTPKDHIEGKCNLFEPMP